MAIAAVGAAFALLPQIALAHALLLQSDPAPDSLLGELPSRITLIFTEAVTPAGAGIKVFAPSGAQVASTVESRGSVLSSPVHSTEIGTFVVTWQVFAADTHPSRGVFAFSVGRKSGNPYASLLSAAQAGTTSPLGLALQAIARWVHFIGFALAFGAVAYAAILRRPRRSRVLVGAGIALLIAAEPLLLVAQLASLSFDSDTAIAILGSEFGRLLGLRLAAALAMWAVWTLDEAWPLLGLGIVIAGLDGATSHAIQGLTGVAVVVTLVHVVAMALWFGGLAAFLLDRDPRFPRYALATFGVAAASGALLAVEHTGSLAALGSEYGLALMVKVLLVGAVLGAALLRRHRVELGLLSAALGAASLLAALPPPR